MKSGWREVFFALLESEPREGHCAALAGVTPEYVSRLKARDVEFRQEIARRVAIYWERRKAIAIRRQRGELAALR